MCAGYEYGMADVPYDDKSWLVEQYWEKDKSMPQIAREFGVNSGTIHYWMEKHGIKTRNQVEESKRKRRVEYANYYTNSHGHERWKTSDTEGGEVICYVHRLQAVAEWGFDAVAGRDIHHKNGIPWDNRVGNLQIVTQEEHGELHGNDVYDVWEDKDTPWRDKERLQDLYQDKQLSPPEIADKFDCDPKTIHRWLDLHDIEKRTKSEAARLAKVWENANQ